jgi:hypothetical protein
LDIEPIPSAGGGAVGLVTVDDGVLIRVSGDRSAAGTL